MESGKRFSNLINLDHRIIEKIQIMSGARSTKVNVGILIRFPFIILITISTFFRRHLNHLYLSRCLELIYTVEKKVSILFSIPFIYYEQTAISQIG